MRKTLIAVLVLGSITSCSMLSSFTSLVDPKPSLEVNANLGKNVEQEKSTVKVESGTTEQKADKISNDTSIKADTVNNITNQLVWWQWLILLYCVGTAIPNFTTQYNTIKMIISDLLSPFKR